MHRSIQQLKSEGRLCDVVEMIPYAQFLGLECLNDPDLGLLAVLRQRPTNIGNPIAQAVHGGVVGALLEHAAIIELWNRFDMETVPKTVNVSIDYLRPCRNADTFAQAQMIRQGRRVANLRVEAWQSDRDKPVAAAHAHFLLA